MLNIFIGHDPNEPVAWQVCASSLARHATFPVSITGLFLRQLPMKRAPEGSTEFSFSRFLVPYLCGYKGHALFLDCDMLCRGDIGELFALFDPKYAVQVVKHDYTPKGQYKFLGNVQHAYRRKNWSSAMLFNNEKCAHLTPDMVNTASGLYLHQFQWLKDAEIGSLPVEWNHLVGEYAPNPNAKIAHFTLGTPCFAKYRDCEFSAEWFAERDIAFSYNKLGEYSLPAKEAA